MPLKTLLVGLSGPSSSGKTTLARFLRSIFKVPASESTHQRSIELFILHEDDFYKTDKDIPVRKLPDQNPSGLGSREVQDWDCVESIDLPLFESTMRHIKDAGYLPTNSFSKEDQNEVGPTDIPDDLVNAQRKLVSSWLQSVSTNEMPEGTSLRICILDGFLLYPPKDVLAAASDFRHLDQLSQLLDLKLFVTCSRKQTIERRAQRKGYVTLEGFWEDPEGYVEDVVWPNFMRDHRSLVQENGEEGRLSVNGTIVKDMDLVVADGGSGAGLEGLIQWGVDVLLSQVR